MAKTKEVRMTWFTDKKVQQPISCKDNFQRKCYNWFTVTRTNLGNAMAFFDNYWGEGHGHGFEFSYSEIDSQIKKTELVLAALKKAMNKSRYESIIKNKDTAIKQAKSKKAKDGTPNWKKAEKKSVLLG